LRGAERDRRLFSAARAGGLSLDLGVAVVLSGGGGSAEDGDAFGFASLAALGFVLELFVVEEKLFPGSENEITPTVDTLQHLVLKFHLRMAPFSPFPRAQPRGKSCGGSPKIQVVYCSPSVQPLGLGPPRPRKGVGTNYRALYAGRMMSM